MIMVIMVIIIIIKGKFHPRRGHKGPEEEYRCRSTFSLTSAPNGVGDQHHASTALLPGKRLLYPNNNNNKSGLKNRANGSQFSWFILEIYL
jgi:hypothetical protein